MNSRKRTVLISTAAALAVGEIGSAIIIWRESYPGSMPLAAVVFAAFFAAAAWLLRSGRAIAGSVFTGVLCLFEVVSFPGWARHNALDWVYQTTFAVVALAGLIAAIAVLTDRVRHRAAA
jgi:hypothetical protein